MKYNIIVVDDDPIFLKKMKFLIDSELQDFHCLYLLNPLELLEKIKELECDVFLVDQKMPQILGSELVKKILLVNKEKVKKIIIMTDFWDELDISGACLNENLFFLNKPFSFEELDFFLKRDIF